MTKEYEKKSIIKTKLINITYLPVNHIGYHHYRVYSRVWKFQRQFCCFYIKGHDNRIRAMEQVFSHLDLNMGDTTYFDSVPMSLVVNKNN